MITLKTKRKRIKVKAKPKKVYSTNIQKNINNGKSTGNQNKTN